MDYERLIDEETWAFIRRTAESYPDDAVDLSIEDQRRVYDTMCQDFRQPRPKGVETQDLARRWRACSHLYGRRSHPDCGLFPRRRICCWRAGQP